jgi:3-dehydroquinate synthase
MLGLVRVVRVPLRDRTYSILIGERLLSRLGAACRKLRLGRRCAIITDTNVAPLHATTVERSLKQAGFESFRITVPAGEPAKSLSQLEDCYNQLAARRMERSSFIVALGGGVVGDLAGFVAATYLRGLPFMQVPTTLLAQVDSSVGGKVAVNLDAGKNLVGAFYQPRLVLCDLTTLHTLPQRELRAGVAEVIKYGIIRDAQLFERLERQLDRLFALEPAVLGGVVSRCCEIKAEVVGQDETEGGLRAILNFGHTIGHAIENSFGYGRYLHGEAIAIGQVAAARLSQAVLGLSEAEAGRVEALLKAAGLPVEVRLTAAAETRLLRAMQLDKKVTGGDVRFVLAKRIGEVVWGQRVPAEAIRTVLRPPTTAQRSRGKAVCQP